MSAPTTKMNKSDSLQSLSDIKVRDYSTLLISVVFFLSGFSALLYQVAWQRLLTVHYGVGSTTVTTIVTVYMLGLGLGSLFGGYLSSKTKHLIPLYCGIEILIALFGIFSLPILSFLGQSTAAAPPMASMAYMFAFLCIPTILMGTTLPILTSVMMKLNANFLKVVSALYCVNTLGASLGAFFGAYVLISFLGLDSNVYTAATVNFMLVAAILFLLPKSRQEKTVSQEEELVDSESLGKIAYLCVFLTGFIAIAYEIIWFRTVELLVKASPYAFATVLMVYLFGIALGSWVMNMLVTRFSTLNKKPLFYFIQCAIAVYGISTYTLFFYLAKGPMKPVIQNSFRQELHPNFGNNIFSSVAAFQQGWFVYFDFLIWPALFMLVPTILMGASFPLISSLARTASGEEGKVVGNIYFFNVIGNVAGAIVAGFCFLELFGTANSALILSILALPFFYLLFKELKPPSLRIATSLFAVAAFITGALLFPSSKEFIKTIHVNPLPGEHTKTFVEEGSDAVVVTYKNGPLVWHYVNGLAHGGKQDYMYGFYRRALDGMTYCKDLKNVLVIGYGTGSIVDAVLRSDDVDKVTVVEISQSAMDNLLNIEEFKRHFKDPRVELVIDDGRRFLNRKENKYDCILMDPLRSKTAYSNNIYSREFIRLCGNHLTDGGVLMVWLDDYVRLPRTIASEFSNARLYEQFCLAANRPMQANLSRREQILSKFKKEEIEKIENFYPATKKIGHSEVK